MPTITMNISLPDELKARMDKDRRNWSAVARNAFELELKCRMDPEGDMSAVVERLKASKERIEQMQKPDWLEMGREWAMNEAEFDELERVVALARTEGFEYAYPNNDLLVCALYLAVMDEEHSGPRDIEEFCERTFGKSRIPSYAQLGWFIDGAEEVGDEVLSQV